MNNNKLRKKKKNESFQSTPLIFYFTLYKFTLTNFELDLTTHCQNQKSSLMTMWGNKNKYLWIRYKIESVLISVYIHHIVFSFTLNLQIEKINCRLWERNENKEKHQRTGRINNMTKPLHTNKQIY